MSTRRSEAASGVLGAYRNTLRVRNPSSGVVYHLVFDGNLSKLTGAQLKRHLEGICLIPAAQQVLLFRDTLVEDRHTAAGLGLHDRALLELHADASQSDHPFNARANHPLSSAEHPLSQSDHPLSSANHPLNSANHPLNNANHPLNNANHPLNNANHSLNNAVWAVEEDAMGDVDGAMRPFHDADLQEARLEQREYVWVMEQMRFETERMHRERELLRQRQNLEHEAEVLERERCMVGRRTLLEKRKLLELQQWVREEMATEAQLLQMHNTYGGGGGYEGNEGNGFHPTF